MKKHNVKLNNLLPSLILLLRVCVYVFVYGYCFYIHRYKLEYVDKGISCVWSPCQYLYRSVRSAFSV